MKIAVAQINTIVGDFEGNSQKIVEKIKWAKQNGADLVLFPEMAITGYPPKDLLDKSHFVSKGLASLEKVASATDKDIAAIVGVVSLNESARGKGLFNSAAFLAQGKICSIHHKTLLPNYDVFDETRHFEPAGSQEIIEYKGQKIGLTICEDIWFEAEFSGRKLYTIDPVKNLVDQGADLIINIAASPYTVGKNELRESLTQTVAKKYSLPVIYVNLGK